MSSWTPGVNGSARRFAELGTITTNWTRGTLKRGPVERVEHP
jgi:hypothetical protein